MRILPLLLLVFCASVAGAKSLILQPSHGGDGSAWGNNQCASCHLLNFIHADTTDTLRQLVREKSYDSCTACHGSNGSEAIRECGTCHNESDLPYSSGQQGLHKHNFISISQQVSGLTDENCITCHDSSDMNGEFDANVDLTHFSDKQLSVQPYRNSSDFCLSCHNRDHQQAGFEMNGHDYRDPLVAMQDNYLFIDKHGAAKGSGERTYAGLRNAYEYPSEVLCTDCHAMHGTDNDSLIIANADHGASRLSNEIKQRNIPVNVRNGEFAQLCVLCHAMRDDVEDAQRDTGNGLNGVHQAQGSCLTCHRHGMAVQTGL